CYDAKRMIEETNCDAVMIGRGLLGNPWLIKETIDYLNDGTIPSIISNTERLDMILKHFNYLLKTKNEKLALLEMRTHASYYLKNMPNSYYIKQEIFKTTTYEEFIGILNQYRRDINA
ncbi:MAG: tRNA-dihydrouridine synthase, partial [Bacilli bacterium]|nr:tRNA-dihydrouridine synthase [Bacilli bacterium]